MPSVSASLPTNPLSNAERVDVRRFCGYPLYGPGNSGFVGYRFFQAYGMLEYRLTNMADEELQVTRQFLIDLYTLEQAIPAMTGDLDVSVAAVYTRNKYEQAERRSLYAWRRAELCKFLGVPKGPSFVGDRQSIVI